MKPICNKFRLIIYLFFLFAVSSCEDFLPFDQVNCIWIKNESNQLVHFLVGYNYPDTTIPDAYNKRKGVSTNSKTSYDSKEKWKDVFKALPSDTLSVFIFSIDDLNKYDWQTVRKEYKILKRYDVSLQDLERLEYLLTYPPNEAMKNVKMYPPYGK